MATKVIARTNWALGNDRTRVKRPTGTIIAPPKPCKMRHATNVWISADRPHSNEPNVNIPTAAENTWRVPDRSANQPLTGTNTATLKV
jgi:hypothetical protein